MFNAQHFFGDQDVHAFILNSSVLGAHAKECHVTLDVNQYFHDDQHVLHECLVDFNDVIVVELLHLILLAAYFVKCWFVEFMVELAVVSHGQE